jgi:DNA-binding response OmpR family regulator
MQLLLLTNRADSGKSLLPALELLDHAVAAGPLAPADAGVKAACDVVIVDATTELAAATQVCRAAVTGDAEAAVVVVVAEGGLAALKHSWGFDDWLLPTATPAEVETRLRLAADRRAVEQQRGPASIGDLSIDEDTYVVRLRGQPLDLTYREFELLKFLAQNAGRVFTRSQLLQQVWGYDYFGGTRTVDVHVRRLRAKLGAEHDQLIGTVRNVGYRFVAPASARRGEQPGSAAPSPSRAGERSVPPQPARAT